MARLSWSPKSRKRVETLPDRPDDSRAGREAEERVDPPSYRANWYDPVPIDPMAGDPGFGQEDPEALRGSGARAVAQALAGLADWGRLYWRKDVREVSTLILEWIDQDGGQFDDLLADIGFRPKRGPSFTFIRNQAERDALLREVISLPRWGNQTPMQVARAIRDAFDDYEINGGWARDQKNGCGTEDVPRAQFWAILKLGLHYPLPSIQTLAAMVEESRN